jgi:hypothetical protein
MTPGAALHGQVVQDRLVREERLAGTGLGGHNDVHVAVGVVRRHAHQVAVAREQREQRRAGPAPGPEHGKQRNYVSCGDGAVAIECRRDVRFGCERQQLREQRQHEVTVFHHLVAELAHHPLRFGARLHDALFVLGEYGHADVRTHDPIAFVHSIERDFDRVAPARPLGM